jgi:VCBS repeat-containing protein
MSRADPPPPPGPAGPGAGTAAPRRKLARRGPRPMALEQRMMFDGAAVAAALPDLAAPARPDADPADLAAAPVAYTSATDSAAPTSARLLEGRELPTAAPQAGPAVAEILFVDVAVPGLEALRTQLRAGVELVVLDAARDPWAQMTHSVARHQDLNAVHLLAHGAPGRLLLSGEAGLQDALDSAAAVDALAQWAAHLSAQADILVYGCSSGSGDEGRLLLERIARLTQADVAASTDASGSALAGGNWVLEAATGPVETALPFAPDWLAGTAALLAAPSVSTTAAPLEVVEPSALNPSGASTATLSGWTLSDDALSSPQVSVDVTLANATLGALDDPGGGLGGLVSALPDGLRFVGLPADAQAWLNQLRFTAADVELGTTAASTLLSVRVTDSENPALSATATLRVTVTPSNDPVTVADGRLQVLEGAASTPIGTVVLAAVDPEVAAGSQFPDQIVYTLVTAPTHGRLLLRGAALGPGSSFTHADVIDPAQALVYEHAAGGTEVQNTEDRFELSINDGATADARSDTAVVTVPITPVNQAPVVASGGSGPAGAFVVFEGQPFGARSDGVEQSRVGLAIVADGGGDPGDTTLDLAITRLPSSGQLRFTGTAWVDGMALAFDRALTAADLAGAGFVIAYADRAALRYQHDGSDVAGVPADDSFDVIVTDGGGGTPTRQSASATVLVDVRAANDEPVLDPASPLRAQVTVNGPNGLLDGGGDDYRVRLDTTMLRATDVDSADSSIAFVVTRLPQDGELLLDDAVLQSGASFTMADLAAWRVHYVQRAANVGGTNALDDFEFQVRDGTMTLRWDASGEDFLRQGGIHDGGEASSPARTLTFTLDLAATPTGSGGSGSAEATPVPTSTLATQHVGLPSTGSGVGSLSEGGTVVLTGAMLSYAAGSVPANQIVYTIAAFEGTTGPWNGSLQNNGTALGVLDTFTQGDVDAGRVSFVHGGGEDFESSVRFYVSAPGAASAEGQLSFHATPVNDAPTATGASGVTLAEGGSVTITAARLTLADPDDATSEAYLENDPSVVDNHTVNAALDHGAYGGDPLRWRVAALPTAGRLQVDLAGNGTWTDLTATDVAAQTLNPASLIAAGRLRYVHDGLEARSDSFQVVARDRWGSESNAATVRLSVTNINDAPEIAATPLQADPSAAGRPANAAGGAAANEPLTVIQEGSYTRITSALLQAYDSDSSAQQVQYRITTAPVAGRLAYSANGSSFTTIGLGSSFSQRQVQDGQIYYLHAGAEPASSGYPGTPDDRFTFTLSDGNREQAGNEFWIYVRPTNDPPAVTAPAGPVDIDSLQPGRNPVAGFGVTDPDLAGGLHADERDFVQVTVRLLAPGGAAPASYATGFGGGGVLLGHALPADTGGDWTVTRSGLNDILQFQGSRAQVNAALAGLDVTFAQDLDASWTLQVIADDRLRDSAGALPGSGLGANGGAWNQPASSTGSPGAVPATAFDWTSGAAVPAGHPNVSAASVLLRASGVNDTATLTAPAAAATAEDARSRVGGVFVVADAESAAFDLPVSVTLAVNAGTLDLGPAGAQASLTPAGGQAVSVAGDGSALLTLAGRAADIQALLNARNLAQTADDANGGVYHTSAPDLNGDQNGADAGDVTLTLTLDDTGARIGGDIGAGSVAALPAAARVALTIAARNDAPVLAATVLSPTAQENEQTGSGASVPAVRLLAGAAVSDVDLGSTPGLVPGVFGAGTLTVTLVDGIAGDLLQVGAALPAGVSASGGSGATPLVLTFGAGTTLAEVAALLDALEYTHTGDDPTVRGTDLERLYTVVLSDGDNAQAGGSAGGPAGLASNMLQGTVRIEAANDAPSLAATAPSAFVETADASAQTLAQSGTLTVSDPDHGSGIGLAFEYDDDLAWSGGTVGDPVLVAALSAGTFSLSSATAAAPSSAGWSYTATSVDLDFLGAGETLSFGFTVAATDPAGAAGTARLAFTVEGRNDAPTVDVEVLTAELTEGQVTGTPLRLRSDGSLQFADPDTNDLVGASVQWVGVSGVGQPHVDAALSAALAGALTLSGDGVASAVRSGTLAWSFALDDALVRHLSAEQSLTATWRITLSDDSGAGNAATTRDVSVTLRGANAAPTLAVEAADDFVEALDASAQDLEQSGRVTFDDVDEGSTLAFSVNYNDDIAWTGGPLDPVLAQALTAGGLSLSALESDAPGSLQWHYEATGLDLDFLEAGQSITLSFDIRATDAEGATSSKTLALRIVGTAEVPALEMVDLEGKVTEDRLNSGSNLRDTGFAGFHDLLDVAQPVVAEYTYLGAASSTGEALDALLAADLSNALHTGEAEIDPATGFGLVPWTFAIDNALTQLLAAGETVVARWRIALAHEPATTQEVTVTLHGVNDAPVLEPIAVGDVVVEDQTSGTPARLRASGSVGFAEVDRGDLVSVEMVLLGASAAEGIVIDAALAQALAGTLTLGGAATPAAAGTITWAFALDNALTQSLGDGESVTATWQLRLTDDSGSADATATQALTVTIQGANDAPVVVSGDLTGSVTEDQTSGAPAALSDSGALTWAETDLSDRVLVTRDPVAVSASAGVDLNSAAFSALQTALASALTLSGAGVASAAASGSTGWAVALDNALVQFLGAGESVTATWRLRLTDDSGRPDATTTRDVVVTIFGANDTPVLTAVDVSGTVGEDATSGTPARLRDSGSVAFTDTDAGDLVSASVALQGIVRSGGAPSDAALDAALAGALSLTGAGASAGAAARAGTLGWAFELEPALAQSLAPGQNLTATWRLSFTDDSGASDATATQDVSITLTGANDSPVVDSADLAGEVTEDITSGSPVRLRDGGTLDFRDVDAGQIVSASTAWLGSSAAGGASVTTALNAALAGALTLSGAGTGAGAAQGTLNWNFALDNALTQTLGAGESVTGTWRVTLADGAGGSVTRDVVVTVRGTNDAPVVTSADLTGSVAEDETSGTLPLLRDSGALSWSEIDSTDLLLVTADAVQVSASDGVDLGSTAGTTLRDALGNALTLSGAGVGSAAASGSTGWAFALDSALVQFLGAGESVTATWRLRLTDDSGSSDATVTRDVVVTIHGASDAPVVTSADLAGSVTEDQTSGTPAALRDSGALTWTEADAPDRVLVTVDPVAVSASAGVDLGSAAGTALQAALANALTLSGAGVGSAAASGSTAWAFALDDALVKFLGAGESVTATWRLRLTDDSGSPNDTTPRDVVVTIFGANDAPVLTAVDVSGTVGEDATSGTPARLRDSGSVAFADTDAGDLVSASVALQGIVRSGGAPSDAALDAALAGALSLTGAGASAGAAARAGTLGWAFELDPALAQSLAPGQSLTATWRLSFTDDSGGPGATATQDVSITLTGVNDAPVVDSADLAGEVTEDVTSGSPARLRDGGTLDFRDVDAGQLVSAGAAWLGSSTAGGASVSTALDAALAGALTLSGAGTGAGAAEGTLNWNFALDNALTQTLGAGESVTGTWRLTLADGAGGSVSRDVAVTMRGVNDAPLALDDTLVPALGGTAAGALIAGSDSDVEGEPMRIVRVGDVEFVDLAPSTDPARPAAAGWRELALQHGTLYLLEDGTSAYTHGGRTFLVEPLDAAGVLEQRLADGRWQVLEDSVVMTLQALQAGALRYTPGPGEVGAPEVVPARVTERDWRGERVSYVVSDGRAESTAWLDVSVGSGAGDFGAGLQPGADADVDGIPSAVEAALASRITGEAQGLRAQTYMLGLAYLGAAGAGEPMLLTLKAVQQGDLDGDGTADALQNAVATFAWIDHVQFALGNSAPGDLASGQPIVTLVAQAALTGSGPAHAAAQLGGVQVQALSAEQAADFDARFNFSSRWSPLAFDAAPLAGSAGAGAIDVDPAREGAQWRFTIDLSRSGEAPAGYLGFVKWVDPLTIERYRDAGLQLLDLDGQAITAPGWADFSRRASGGDGALLVSDVSGCLWLDIVVTDNRFGDSDTTVGRITDLGVPVFVNERDDRRPLTLSQPVVNEGSAWAQFQIQGAARQIVTLRLEAGTATGGGVDFGSGDARNLMVSADGGATWTAYTGGEVRLSDTGTLLVRTPVVDDTVYEASETFRLVARTTGGREATGLATLRDDGVGAVFRDDGSVGPAAALDDDRPVHAPPAAAAGPAAAPIATMDAMRLSSATTVEPTPPVAPFDSALVLGGPTALAMPERPALGDVLTSPAGFRVVVLESGRPGLSLFRPVADQFFPSNRTVSFTIPADTFAHTMANAVLRLEARLADGRELPGWVRFDPRTGTFVVTPPAGLVGDLDVRITARDQDGRQVTAQFKIKVTSGVIVNPGRPGLSEQLGTAGESQRPAGAPVRPAGEPASERPQAGKTRPEPGKRAVAGPTRVADRPGPAERGEVAGKKRPVR